MSKFLCAALLLALLSGCGEPYGVSCSCPAPSIGLFADAELEVVLVEPGFAADRAGIQAGDILRDLRLVQLAPGESGKPVAFSNVTEAQDLISRGILNGCCSGGRAIRLRIQRGEQVIELSVTPGYSRAKPITSFRPLRVDSAVATPTPTAGMNPTPVPSDWNYF